MARRTRANSTTTTKPAPEDCTTRVLGHEVLAPITKAEDVPRDFARLRPQAAALLAGVGRVWLVRDATGVALLRTNSRA